MDQAVPLFGIYRDAAMNDAAIEVLNSGQIAAGKFVNAFAAGFGALANQKHVVTMNDMSSAIQIALRLCGVEPGDQVLTTSYACMSTNAPIASSGAKPVWVDIDPLTGTMDPESLEQSITPQSKAVIVYHLAGYPADIGRIAAICKKHGLKLIEDCDNALLATVRGAEVGTFGDFAIYSFYPNRQINATEGGALACREVADAERATKLRRYGIDSPRFRDSLGEIDPHCDVSEIGWAATLNNLCSAIGHVQLSGVRERLARTRAVAKRLSEELRGIQGLTIVEPLPNCDPSYWAFLVTLNDRDRAMSGLKKSGVNVSKLHHRTDLYSGFGTGAGNLPNTRTFLEKVLALPCGWWLTETQVDMIVERCKQAAAEDVPA